MSELRFSDTDKSRKPTVKNPQEECRLYDRVPVMNYQGRTLFYSLILSPGNTLATELCGRVQNQSMLKEVLLPENMGLLCHNHEKVMVTALPSLPWVRLMRKYVPERIIMLLPPGVQFEKNEADNVSELHAGGMQFAVALDALGDVAKHPAVLKCVSYAFVNDQKRDAQMKLVQTLKAHNPELKTIGFKGFGRVFSFLEARNYDLVCGKVDLLRYHYDRVRPEWQHVMMRSFAELFSGIYDLKDISSLAVEYPIIGASMKKLLGSAEILACLQGSRSINIATGKLSQKGIRDLICIALAYNLYCMSEKGAIEQHFKRTFENVPAEMMNTEHFIYALQRGRLVELFSQHPCDDFGKQQAFMAGFLSKTHSFLHDEYQKVTNDFIMNAVASYYTNDSTALGKVIKFVDALSHINQPVIADIAAQPDFAYSKDNIYDTYFQSLRWTEAVCKALGI